MQRPNERLRRARLALPSPSGSERPMSRQELADAVNAAAFADTGRVSVVSANYVGKLESGVHRWPNAVTRRAFRAVLGAELDADLGFFIIRGVGDSGSADGSRVEERCCCGGAAARAPVGVGWPM
jgi:hypothetical protein